MMKKIISHALARDIRASFASQIAQLDHIEAELAHIDFTKNSDDTTFSDAQVLAIRIQDARDALCTADAFLREQVPDREIYSQPPRFVAAVLHFFSKQKGGV